MVRLYRTFTNCIFTGGIRCVGYLYATSGWFNRREPPRTFSNHFSTEKVRCVEVFCMSSGWFDYTEPSDLHRGNKVCRVPIRYFRVVQPQRTSSNLFEPLQCRESKVCRGLSHEFGVVRLYRTVSNCIFTGGTRCVGTYTLVPTQRTSLNLLEPLQCRESKVCRCLSHEFGVV